MKTAQHRFGAILHETWALGKELMASCANHRFINDNWTDIGHIDINGVNGGMDEKRKKKRCVERMMGYACECERLGAVEGVERERA